MLVKPDRLRRARDFALLSQKGRVVFGPFFTLRFRPSQTPTKVGFVASTKLFKTAVERNRAKRRMREALRALKSDWPKHMDLLFILKPETKTLEFASLLSNLRRAFEKIPEALARPPVPRPPRARKKTSVIFRNQK
jgi:ribonuclease P protein component